MLSVEKSHLPNVHCEQEEMSLSPIMLPVSVYLIDTFVVFS